jgi:hypothetical protein
MVTMITDRDTCNEDIFTVRREKLIYMFVKITRILSAPHRS